MIMTKERDCKSKVIDCMEYHVAVSGDDSNPGTTEAPFKSIMKAACIAQPGDTITVHKGVYREYIDPPRGGESDDVRITYQAAEGEKVAIKGSEEISDWIHVDGTVWKRSLPNEFFGRFNPYANKLGGDWFFPEERDHHSGQVYINDKALNEAKAMEDLFASGGMKWFAINSEWETTLWVNFGRLNPNEELVEINVRQSVFYPSKPGRNYITVRGFTLSQAATPWSPPTTEQIGLIGVNWSKGWVIEDNTITHSRCTGLTLGKFFDRDDGGIQYGFNAHYQAVKRVLERGDWTPENIGHHVVRNNHISHCEQGGIVGSHGGAFSIIEGNVIHDIHVRKLFSGFEQAGIKLHAPVDTIIRNNLIFNCHMGVWLDWMTQGSRVSHNTMYDNHQQDLFLEIAHGPVLVDNNILLSKVALLDSAQGNAFVHNLFGGEVRQRAEGARETHYFAPHDTECLGIKGVRDGDERFFNNLVIHEKGLKSYDNNAEELWIDRNVYINRAGVPELNQNALSIPEAEDRYRVENIEGRVHLHIPLKKEWEKVDCNPITTDMLGQTRISNQCFENPDGSPITIDEDAFGNIRDSTSPFPGPFELKVDVDSIPIWPLREGAQILTPITEEMEEAELEPR